MKHLKIYFDGRCELCVALVRWIERQPQLVPLRCVPKLAGPDDLVVVADSGLYWQGDSAWLMVLWALDDYRSWSYRLGSPTLLPLARQMFATLSQNRHQAALWLGLPNDEDLAARLRDVTVPGCRR
ncbi:MAG: DUF393 domain-containing protein [Bryobacterales bacterium]|nr:DUF393 domain-containing protein [Bryobacterales bacterium]